MSEFVSKLVETEDQILDTVSDAEENVVDGVKKVVEAVEPRLPALGIELPEAFPSIEELIETQYAFAAKVLDNQRKFVLAILEAAKPLSTKVVVESAKPKVVAEKKTAKAA